MNPDALQNLLGKVRDGTVSPEQALTKIKAMPYQDLDFARLDHHRALRKGFPEVIFGQGKTLEQLETLLDCSLREQGRAMATRIDKARGEALVEKLGPRFTYCQEAALITGGEPPEAVGSVLVCCAGTADLPVAQEAHQTLRFLGSHSQLLADVGVAGLHRLLAHVELLQSAKVIVVVAGMEGALVSVVAGLVSCPVIAVPTSVGYGASFGGLAALLAMLSGCAPGVTVVNIDNGFGAAYSAHLINKGMAEA